LVWVRVKSGGKCPEGNVPYLFASQHFARKPGTNPTGWKLLAYSTADWPCGASEHTVLPGWPVSLCSVWNIVTRLNSSPELLYSRAACTATQSNFTPPQRSTGNESVPKIIINNIISLCFKTTINISLISNHNSFRALLDKIASVYFVRKIYLYFRIRNGQPREPALCQLYRHTFIPCTGGERLYIGAHRCE